MTFGEILMYIVSYFGLFTSMYFILILIENRDNLKNPLPSRFPSVTIIVPAYNEEHTLKGTVDSLLALDYPRDLLKIIIVDDGSRDRTLEIARTYESNQVTVLTQPNGGKGSAINNGLRHSTTELVGCLDADSFVETNALKRMVGYFDRSEVMAVTPSMKVYEAHNFLQAIQRMEYMMGIFLRKVFAFLGSIHVTPGPFSIYRKKFFDQYGGFSEHNLTEDIEVALRIQRNNFAIENSIDAFVYTVAPDNWATLEAQRVRWYTGFTTNVINYRDLFSSKHGNLGMFVLPASFFSVFLVIVTMFYTIITTVQQQFKDFMMWYNIDFDILAMFDFNKDFFYYNFHTLTLISIVSVTVGIAIIMLAKYLSREEVGIKLHYILYMAFYWVMFGYWWVISFYKVAFRKDVGWAHKSDQGGI